jgi:hypothetical protein
MKKFSSVLMVAGVMLVIISCVDKEPTFESEKFSIRFSLDGSDPELQDARLLLSISNSKGDEVMYHEEIAYSKDGDSFVTATLDFPPGNYSINDFFLVTKDDDIIFALPRKNTPLADLVNSQHNFHIGSETDHIVNLLLLNPSGREARAFGYDNYRVKRRKSLNVAIKVTEGGQARFASGEAFILQGLDTTARFPLAAGMNKIHFTGNGDNYTLVLIKNGFSRYSQTITVGKHVKPIIAQLKPAFSMVVITNPDGYFAYELDGWPGDLVFDWGDGSIENVRLGDPNDVDVVRDHQYAQPGRYYVSVTGELDKINTLLFSQFTDSFTDRINVERTIGSEVGTRIKFYQSITAGQPLSVS